ncbi:carbohydrate ABC transporter permease [Paenibacillus gansuensis]|uniref:Carbohydrate ABC transporter permease n=1 Tax=Paenibacillus gansuensis TaxID=306542 RepID=A0ABW5PAB1_9BACL
MPDQQRSLANRHAVTNEAYIPIPRKKAWNAYENKIKLYGFLFAMPWIIGLLLFNAFPLLASLYYSFTNYSILESGTWVGLENYRALLQDDIFWVSIYNTLYYTAIFVPVSIIAGVALALLLNLNIRGQGIYRTLFFIPSLVPLIASVIIWMWLLNPQFGVINYLLDLAGISGPSWLGDERFSKISLILISLWGIGQSIVIYLAGLQDIPQDYYDAADVDGASVFQRLRHITLPLLTPVIFFNLVMGTIGALQNFILPQVLTGGQGTPANSMMFYVMHLYRNGFGYLKMGYASAMAWILFLLVVGLTALIFATQKKWVYYQGKE